LHIRIAYHQYTKLFQSNWHHLVQHNVFEYAICNEFQTILKAGKHHKISIFAGSQITKKSINLSTNHSKTFIVAK